MSISHSIAIILCFALILFCLVYFLIKAPRICRAKFLFYYSLEILILAIIGFTIISIKIPDALHQVSDISMKESMVTGNANIKIESLSWQTA